MFSAYGWITASLQSDQITHSWAAACTASDSCWHPATNQSQTLSHNEEGQTLSHNEEGLDDHVGLTSIEDIKLFTPFLLAFRSCIQAKYINKSLLAIKIYIYIYMYVLPLTSYFYTRYVNTGKKTETHILFHGTPSKTS